jgi:helix-turn-helix protein
VRIEEIAAAKRRHGYRRMYLRLRREDCDVDRKRVYRLYRDAGPDAPVADLMVREENLRRVI